MIRPGNCKSRRAGVPRAADSGSSPRRAVHSPRCTIVPLPRVNPRRHAMTPWPRTFPAAALLALAALQAARADDRPVAGLIPKAQKPVVLDGKLDEWDGAFVTPVHV